MGVLVSGAGTNLEALLRSCAGADFPAAVGLVISNRPSAGGLRIAARHGVDAIAMPVAEFGGEVRQRDRAMGERFRETGVGLVVCAGYDRVLDDIFLRGFPNAILNIHPSLLPAFAGGMNGVEAALAFGVKVAGCTVQLLEPGLPDGGPVVLQAPVPVFEDDDVDMLRARIHEQEWVLLPEAVALWCHGRLSRDGRRIRILPPSQRGASGVRAAASVPV